MENTFREFIFTKPNQMLKTTIINKLLYVSCFFVFFFSENINAQITINQLSIGFSQACAGDAFNSYDVTFNFSPEANLVSTNQFIIELSDASGSFASPAVVYTSAAGSVTTSPATLSFSLPTTTAGEAYKLRIKSTAPAATSSNSVAFAAYYKIQDSPFSINNLVATATFCAGGSYLLTIDNPGTGTNDSPLQYPSLTYNWYKETSPTTSVFVAAGSSLSVNVEGIYYVETNYGSCTSNSFSNRVTVNEETLTGGSNITSSQGNPFCASAGATTLSATAGNSYQWYKDGLEISGATNQTYDTNESGVYSVTINFGGCEETASIDLQTEQFTSSIDVSDIANIEQGETLLVTVTTSTTNPEYKWYLNGTMIPGADQNSYGVTEIGDYKVEVTQTSGCVITNEYLFVVDNKFPDVANIPNLISPNGDGINDTWILPQAYVSGTNTEVVVMSSIGEIVLKTNDYQNNWPVNPINFTNINPVYYYIITTQDNRIKKGSITIVK
tara:strand:- start:1396 stop:2892 length:1497 start_codon:yes stop_codon:yes gene_type:complete